MEGYSKTYYKRLFEPSSDEPFKLSRSKIDLFIQCPRCFYLDRRFGINRPDFPAFTLNSAVDSLLKKEFDIHRAIGTPHPLMEQYHIDAVPFDHEKINEWRANFTGVQSHHKPSNFLVFGAVDDIWIDKEGNLMVVDYKATSTEKEISLDDPWKQSYKRQLEVYQWLLRANGFKVSSTGHFVFCNGKTDREAFDGKLEFDIQIISYTGDDSWIDNTLLAAKKCLMAENLPPANGNCEYCGYRHSAHQKESIPISATN